MKLNGLTPILNVSDIPASMAWFESLGWKNGFVWGEQDPGFASVRAGRAEIFLCHNGQGSRGERASTHEFDEGTGGVWMSWFLDSRDGLEALHARAQELGYDVAMPPTDEPWGIREFHLRHPDGHTFRVGCESG